MRNIKMPILMIGIIVLIAVIGITTKINHNHAGSTSAKQDVYYCPMHPNYTSNKPGDCPICNMKLVKREDEPSQAQAVPVTTQTAKNPEDICLLHNCPKLHDGQPCPMLVMAKAGEKVTCPMCGTHIIGDTTSTQQHEKKILYWTDPMIPGYKSDKPGKSPMGMDLVPVYEEETPQSTTPSASPEGYASILVTPQKQQLIGIKTAPAERRKLIKTIRTVGTIAHDPELYQAQAEYIQAIQAFERSKQSAIPDIVDQAKRLVESTYIRLKHLGLSDDLIQEIATWKEPDHGLLFAHPGDPVWTYAQIYEYELPLVHIGQELTVDVPALSGQTFKGTVRAIDPMVDPTTRTTRLRTQIQDPQGQLKPDMYVNVTITIDLGETLAIPEEAVFDSGTKKIAFVDKGQGLFEPRDVTVGSKADGYYELKDGIKEGEIVVTNGNFLIDSESRLKAALQDMTAGGGHQHGQ